jgi:predicted PurR-regulated permease PerM
MAVSHRSNIVFAFAIAVGLFLCYLLRRPLVLIYVSIIFAIVFSPIVHSITRIRIRSWSPSRGVAILLFIFGVLIAIGGFLALALPPIVHDAHGLSNDLPKRLQQLSSQLSHLPFGEKIASKLDLHTVEGYLGSLLANVFTFFQSVAGGITAVLTIIILTAYFILDGERTFDWALSLVPTQNRDRLRCALSNASRRVQKWLAGQLLLMLILGSASALTFGLLGIRYYYALAVFAGVVNFVPILGPIATVVLASVVAAIDSWVKVLGVWIFYAVYQQVENSYLTPKIMKATVDLPAVAVIIALLIGGELAGLLGAIVAVPTAALVATVINEYLVQPDEKQSSESLTLRKVS